MKRYCVGFLFDGPGQFVALIKKNRPDWQAGLLNGVGGHIEDGEDPAQAMAREFKEEAGVDVPAEKWRCFAKLLGESVEVYCFTCRRNVNLRSQTDEPVGWYHPRVVDDGTTLPSLKWLLPMAQDEDNLAMMAVVENVAR